jgi:hypothetical protein
MHSSSRLLPAILVLAAAVIAVGVLSVAAFCAGRKIEPTLRFLDPRRAPTGDEAVLTYAVEYALHSNEPNDVVFIGDSTCTEGINPLWISRLTGLRSYNLGTAGGLGPDVYLVILKSHFKGHPKPRLVVLCLSPFAMEQCRSGEWAERFVANYGTEVGAFRMATTAEYFIKRGVLSVTSRGTFDVRELPLDGVNDETYWTLQSRLEPTRGFHMLRGYHGGPSEPSAATETFIRSDWDAGVRRIAQACEESGVPLRFLFMPMSRTAVGSRDFAQLDRWSDELERAYPHLHFRRPLLTVFNPDVMWDVAHMNADGVHAFMPLVAKDVQAALGK